MNWYKHSSDAEFRSRLGKCYELSGRYVSEHPNAILVHGKIYNRWTKGYPSVDHAWVEEGNEVFDPVWGKRLPLFFYYELFNAEVHKKYSYEEVLKKMLREGNWGPWE